MSAVKETNMKRLLDEPLGSEMILRLGLTTVAGVREIARYCGTSEQEVLRRFAILPAAVFQDVKTEAKADSLSQMRAECICVSSDTQLQTFSLYWIKGVNSRRCEYVMNCLYNESPDVEMTVKLGQGTRAGLRDVAAYCELDEEEFLRRVTAIFVRTLEDIRTQGEYDSSAELKAVYMYASGDNQTVKGNTFIFRPGRSSD